MIFNKRKNKKGSIQDLIYIIVVALVFSFFLLVGYKIVDSFNTKIQASSDVDTYGKTAVSQINNHFPGIMNNMFLFVIIGLGITTLVLASLIKTHPIFLVFFIIALILIIFFAAIYSNVYQTMASNSALSTQASAMTMPHYVMTYLPFIIGVFGILLAIVMYKTWSNE